jgi:hypothetical protein
LARSTCRVENLEKKWAEACTGEKPIIPGDARLIKDYEQALNREIAPGEDLPKRYGSKIGSLIYPIPCCRPDAAATVGYLARALTFPTVVMEARADQCLRYLIATKDLGILFNGSKGLELKAFSDSDWSTVHSTTGIVLVIAGAPVSYASKRQQSIVLSSCEAEIMAASVTAIETVYVREILRDLGLPQLQPTTLGVDNKGAIQLAKECKITHQSRHTTRRHLKIGEYIHDEIIDVKWVQTLLNISDLFSHLTRAPSYGTATRLCRRCTSWRRTPRSTWS